MKNRKQVASIIGLALGGCLIAALANSAVPAVGEHAEQFTGSLVNTVAGAGSSRPFILAIDRYSSDSELQRFTRILTGVNGQYALRDELWRQSRGYLSIGGSIGYPVSAVLAQEKPGGRTLYAVLNRRLGPFEAQYYTRSSFYPFAVVELNLDQYGHGEGHFIRAAKLHLDGNQLEIESLGTMPTRLLAVRED
jgi:hypothetical protein